MSTYNDADIKAKTLGTWHGGDFALLNYPPRWYERWAGVNDTTRLVLDFKEGMRDAIDLVSRMADGAVAKQVAHIRDTLGCGYVAVAPTSQAGERNVGCEMVAKTLAARYPFLRHLPGALVRTASLTPSHLGGAHSVDEHMASMQYAGPVLAPDLSSLHCVPCNRYFQGEVGFAWHLEHIHKQPPAAPRAFLLIDDVITHGRTGEACRRVLMAATRAPAVHGFYVAKTNGW